MKDPTFWIEARASGLAAYVALTASVLAGLVLKSRPLGAALRPPSVTDTHRFLALLAIGATAVHGVTLLLVSTIRITMVDLLVPGTLPYRPLWTGIGVVAAELMLVVYVSFSQRKRIGTKNWRRLHFATYGIFAAATLHGLLAGSDAGRPWAFALYAAAVGSVATAVSWRVLVPPTPARSRRRAIPDAA